jgi:hypothetical protein
MIAAGGPPGGRLFHERPPMKHHRRWHAYADTIPKDHQGENWVEQPGAHHLLTENTSRTKPAKLLVVFVSNTGDPLKIEDPDS